MISTTFFFTTDPDLALTYLVSTALEVDNFSSLYLYINTNKSELSGDEKEPVLLSQVVAPEHLSKTRIVKWIPKITTTYNSTGETEHKVKICD